MTKKNLLFYAFGLFALSSTGLISCSDDSEKASNKLAFETASSNVNEGESNVTVTLSLNKAASKEVTGTLSLSGTAALNGDYSIDDLSFTIPKGQTTVDIEIDIIDEDLIEAEADELVIELTDVSGISVNSDKDTHTVTINDDDDFPSTGELQTDLSWTIGEGMDIDQVDLDLFHATNVVIDDGVVMDEGDVYEASDNEFGFESLRFLADDPDGAYYVVVFYYEGNDDVDFSLTYSYDDGESDIIEASFPGENQGYAIFYGPIVKEGNDYSSGRTSGRKTSPKSYLKKLDARLLDKLKAAKK